MHFIALIVDAPVIEKILRHVKLWCGPARFDPARPPPGGTSSASPQRSTAGSPPSEPGSTDSEFLMETDPMPDYENLITD